LSKHLQSMQMHQKFFNWAMNMWELSICLSIQRIANKYCMSCFIFTTVCCEPGQCNGYYMICYIIFKYIIVYLCPPCHTYISGHSTASLHVFALHHQLTQIQLPCLGFSHILPWPYIWFLPQFELRNSWTNQLRFQLV